MNSPRFFGFKVLVQRCTPVRHLPRPVGWIEAFIPGNRPTRRMQRLAQRRICSDPHEHLLLSIKPLHPACHARKLPRRLVRAWNLTA